MAPNTLSTMGHVDPSWDAMAGSMAWAIVAVFACYVVAAVWDMADNFMAHRRSDSDVAQFRRSFLTQAIIDLLDENKSVFGRYMDVLELICGLGTVFVYILRSYSADNDDAYNALDFVFSVVFTISYVMHFVAADRTLHRHNVLKTRNIINVVSIAYSFFLAVGWFNGAMSLSFLRVHLVNSRYQRIDGQILASSGVMSDVARHLLAMAVSTFTLVVLFASTVLTLETLGNPESMAEFDDDELDWTFYRATYFTFVTISTVGYGDMSAVSVFGRLACVVFIIGGIIFFSVETGRLVELLRDEGVGTGRFRNSGSNLFVVVIGDLTEDLVFEFLGEFFHPDHVGAQLSMRCIILTHSYQVSIKKRLTHDPLYRVRVKYFRGSVFDEGDFVHRCQGDKADAVFVLTHKFDQSDTANVIRTLAVKRFVPSVPMYAILNQSSNVALMRSAGVPVENIARVDELKMGLLAQNTITPGTATLLTNLLGSNIIPPRVLETYGDGKTQVTWRDEYTVGLGQEIYQFDCPSACVGKTLKAAVTMIYEESLRNPPDRMALWSGVVLFGLGRADDEDDDETGLKTDVLFDLTDDEYLITGAESMFCMCEDLEAALHSIAALSQTDGGDASSRGAAMMVQRRVSKKKKKLASEGSSKNLLAPGAKKTSFGTGSGGVTVGDVSIGLSGGFLSDTDDDEEAGDLQRYAVDADVQGHLRRVRKANGITANSGKALADIVNGEVGGEYADAPLPAAGAAAGGSEGKRSEPWGADLASILPAEPTRHVDRLEPPPQITDHIIVCGGGWVDWLPLYLRPLRRQTERPVVILDDNEPAHNVWVEIAQFGEVYFILGSSLDMFTLIKRARVLHAHRVVCLGERHTSEPSTEQLHLADSEASFTTLILENRLAKYNYKLLFGTTTEFLVDSNVKFLQSQYEIIEAQITSQGGSGADAAEAAAAAMGGRKQSVAAHAAAAVVPRSRRASTITAARMSTKSLVREASMEAASRSGRTASIAMKGGHSQLTGDGASAGAGAAARPAGAPARASSSEEAGAGEGTAEADSAMTDTDFVFSSRYAAGRLLNTGAVTSVMVQAFFNPCIIFLAHAFAGGEAVSIRHMPIAKAYHDLPYQKLFLDLTSKAGLCPLGLFRDKSHLGSKLPYVFANPPAETTVRQGDVAFVLVPRGYKAGAGFSAS